MLLHADLINSYADGRLHAGKVFLKDGLQ